MSGDVRTNRGWGLVEMATQDAARDLVRLLTDPMQPHRSRWEQFGTPYADNPYNASAIGKVLAHQQVLDGRLDELDEAAWPRKRKAWLHDCLTGRRLTHGDVAVFADAFGLDPGSRERVHRLLDIDDSGAMRLSGVVVEGAADADADLIDRLVRHKRFRTAAVTEDHLVGPDRLPVLHRTEQVLVCTDAGADAYLYRFDTSMATVSVDAGGVATDVVRIGDFWGVVIAFDHPLEVGEEHRLSYTTTFSYAQAPEPNFRRGAGDPGTKIQVQVHFAGTGSGRPSRVWQAQWNHVESLRPDFLSEVWPVAGTVSARYSLAGRGLVGFEWRW